jgi:hypothetical protein
MPKRNKGCFFQNKKYFYDKATILKQKSTMLKGRLFGDADLQLENIGISPCHWCSVRFRNNPKIKNVVSIFQHSREHLQGIFLPVKKSLTQTNHQLGNASTIE